MYQQQYLVVTWLVPRKTVAILAHGASSVYTIQPCTSLQCHFIQRYMNRMHVYLAVICHLHLWQNDRDLLLATVVRWGRNEYRNESTKR